MTRFNFNRFPVVAAAAIAIVALAGAPSAFASAMHGHMDMADSGPAHFAPTRQAYTTNHDFLVKLVKLPLPIPYQKYFTVQFKVYSGHHPSHLLHDAKLGMFAGMRHGRKHGFAHGMNSSPKIVDHNGAFTIEGMYFHMMGKWTLKMTITQGKRKGIAYFNLPCCAE